LSVGRTEREGKRQGDHNQDPRPPERTPDLFRKPLQLGDARPHCCHLSRMTRRLRQEQSDEVLRISQGRYGPRIAQQAFDR
jgi:hypothetical protein